MMFIQERANEWFDINIYNTPNDLDKKLDSFVKKHSLSSSEVLDDFIVSTCGEILLTNLNTPIQFGGNFSIINKFSLSITSGRVPMSSIDAMRMARLLKILYPNANTRLLNDFEYICSTGIAVENTPFCVNIVGLYIHFTVAPDENYCVKSSIYDSKYSYYSKELLRSVLVSSHDPVFMGSALVLLQDVCNFIKEFKESHTRFVDSIDISDKNDLTETNKNYHFTLFNDITCLDDLENVTVTYNSAIKYLYTIAKNGSDKSFLRHLKEKIDTYELDLIDFEDNSIINHLKLIN